MIDSLVQAVALVRESLQEKGYKIVEDVPTHHVDFPSGCKKLCHHLFITEKNLVKEMWYCFYKTNPFFTANKFFPDLKIGWAESIDEGVYQKLAHVKPEHIVFIHPEGVMTCNWDTIQHYAQTHGSFRLQKNQTEFTVSIPLRMLTPIYIADKVLQDYLNNFGGIVERGKRIIQSQIKYF